MLTAVSLGRTTAVKHSANNLLHCPVLSYQGEGGGSSGHRMSERKGGNGKGSKEIKRDSVPRECAGPPPSVGWAGYHVCPCVFRSGPWGPITVTLLHSPQTWRKALEVVSTSPSGDETGLSSNKTIPERICLPSPGWMNGCSLIPREE